MSEKGGPEKVKLDPTVDFIAGTVSGIAGLLVGYPFDTIKVRFQHPDIVRKYTSVTNAFFTIVREEKITGLYKGVASPLATCALMNGIVFASYKFLMKIQLDHRDAVPTLAQVALAGAGSGIFSSIITTPTELIKIRQQNMLTRNPAQASARAVALQIYRQHGIRGLYRGITATALRDCGYGAYFAAYEATCWYLACPPAISSATSSSDPSSIFTEIERGMQTLSWPALMFAGGVAGIAGWLATFPFDVVKTRIQGSYPDTLSTLPADRVRLLSDAGHGVNPSAHGPSSVSSPNPYRSTFSTIVNSYRAEGLAVFFRGLAPTLLRAVPVNMVTFAVFELVVNTLQAY